MHLKQLKTEYEGGLSEKFSQTVAEKICQAICPFHTGA